MEDIIETLLGLEIVDESDNTEDMQALARERIRERRQSEWEYFLAKIVKPNSINLAIARFYLLICTMYESFL